MLCRICGSPLEHVFVDLRSSPLANSYLTAEALMQPEMYFPLTVYICDGCLLVQLPPVERPAEIFTDYAYFSSYSDSWLEHCRKFADEMTERLDLDTSDLVVEVASNDGYLLQYFRANGVPVLGVDPAENVTQAAIAKGIPTRVAFFNSATARALASEGILADLLIGNNVLAHVPELVDFVEGLRIALKPTGVLTMEFPHIARLMEGNQFDTIYHEHFSYFSFGVVRRLFAECGLTVFDVEELPTHGGSLRVYARHESDDSKAVTGRVEKLIQDERRAGLHELRGYLAFDERAREAKRQLLEFLVTQRRSGKSIVGYGAAAKGNTLLNYCGVGTDMVDYVVDRSPHKQGRYLPGSRIPVSSPERVFETRPDFLLVLPWNLIEEISLQMAAIYEWGGKFLVAIPHLSIFGL